MQHVAQRGPVSAGVIVSSNVPAALPYQIFDQTTHRKRRRYYPRVYCLVDVDTQEGRASSFYQIWPARQLISAVVYRVNKPLGDQWDFFILVYIATHQKYSPVLCPRLDLQKY